MTGVEQGSLVLYREQEIMAQSVSLRQLGLRRILPIPPRPRAPISPARRNSPRVRLIHTYECKSKTKVSQKRGRVRPGAVHIVTLA
jgi:hypothetical protein